jgi:hypothetical protein
MVVDRALRSMRVDKLVLNVKKLVTLVQNIPRMVTDPSEECLHPACRVALLGYRHVNAHELQRQYVLRLCKKDTTDPSACLEEILNNLHAIFFGDIDASREGQVENPPIDDAAKTGHKQGLHLSG